MASVRNCRQLAFESLASAMQEGEAGKRQRQQLFESFMRMMALEWGTAGLPRRFDFR